MESIEEFYSAKNRHPTVQSPTTIGQFNVFKTEEYIAPDNKPFKYTRRDFYKVSLIRGNHLYHYADRSIETKGATLMFFNPRVPYTFTMIDAVCTGYFCIFKEDFFTESRRGSLNELPMFSVIGDPHFTLTAKQDVAVSTIFEKMLAELNGDYPFKYDVIRNLVMDTVHFALKLKPSEIVHAQTDANTRLTTVFTELLERQFPIENMSRRVTMRSAKDYADRLSVHVNHLNRALRQTTGKTTSQHIYGRLVSEAKILLKHTDWNIADIAYSLGFDEPAHFNNFFKKQTASTPSSFRN